MDRINIRRAVEADVDDLVSLYQAAQRWLADKGSDQWATNAEAKVRTKVACSIRRGECYVAELDGVPIGMITIDEYADPEFWIPEDRPSEALYLHRMVVDRAQSGRNVGRLLLDWADNVATSQGRQWLRLDAWRTNTALQDYYKRQGFSAVRTVELAHRGSGALFERRVGRTSSRSNTRPISGG
jgi:ribosomal protein S18 acetylase RimI-like enzyme